MTCYVDTPVLYQDTKLRFKWWSHLWSDASEEELHALAERIGLRRSWFQRKARTGTPEKLRRFYDHYDVTPSKRLLALRLGAVPIEAREYLARFRVLDGPDPPGDPKTGGGDSVPV